MGAAERGVYTASIWLANWPLLQAKAHAPSANQDDS
jgi:hypothetical protein